MNCMASTLHIITTSHLLSSPSSRTLIVTMARPLAPTNSMIHRFRIARDAFRTDKTMTEEGLQGTGDWPTVLPSLAQCMYDFSMAALRITRESLEYPSTSDPYPPSVASLKNLKPTMLKDLKLETHHRGHCLLIRFVCQAILWGGVRNVAEDENGNGVQFSLHSYMVGGVQNVLKTGSVIILKEPYFKIGTNGQYEIRVDHCTDIVWLSDDDSRIPEKWKRPGLDDPNSAVERGTDLRKKGDLLQAIATFVWPHIALVLDSLILLLAFPAVSDRVQIQRRQEHCSCAELRRICYLERLMPPCAMLPSSSTQGRDSKENYTLAHWHFTL